MQRTSTFLLLIIGLMWLDLTISKAYFEGQILHYNPINGDFQTYNPLRRMAAGQVPGRDFQPYMGLGITYVTYLPFKLMGETFSASKFSAQLMHMWLFSLGSLVLFRLLRFNWFTAFALSFILQLYAYVASDYLYTLTMDWEIAETALPFGQTFSALSHAENSCLGVRIALPFLTAGLLLWIYRRKAKLSGDMEALIWGFIAGAQAFWSNDYGFTSMVVLSASYFLFRGRSWVVPHLIGLIIGFIALFVIATHGYPIRALTYNLGGVAKDQFWYFMLDEEGKVFSLMQYVKAKRIFLLAGISAAFVAGIFLYNWRQRKPDLRDILFFYILATSLAAGLLSTIGGGIMERYFSASLRLMPFAALFVLLKLIPVPSPRFNNFILLIAVLCGVGFYAAFQPVSIRNMQQEIEAKTEGHYFYSAWAGGYLSNSQKQEMVIQKQFKNKKVFSTYSSLMDAASGNFQPSGIDYIIHALGKENREEYLISFAQTDPDFVTTPNELWTLWEVWSRRVNWWFYREMIKKHEPAMQTVYHVVWKKRPQPLDTKKRISQVSCKVNGSSLELTDKLPAGTYYIELTVPQKTKLKKSGEPLIGNRALLVVEEESSGFNAVAGKHVAQPDIRTYNADYTLSPQLLVVEHKAGMPSTLKLRVAPKERAVLKIESCHISGVYEFPHLPRKMQ
jgi:hypothetical protein